jgi:hypothetical protein
MINPLLSIAIALVRRWTRLYTCRMEPALRDSRRAEIESDLWEFHEDARRSGHSPAGIAVHMLARLLLGMPHDVLWRFDCLDDRTKAMRRAAWLTAAAAGAAACVAAAWILFSVASLVALPPLPDSISVERVMGLVPPPPPPPPTREYRTRFERPPPPPPAPPR